MFINKEIYRDAYNLSNESLYIKLSNKPWRDNMFLWQKVKKIWFFYVKIGEPFYLHESFEKVKKKKITTSFKSCANCKHGVFPMPDICKKCGFININNKILTKWESK